MHRWRSFGVKVALVATLALGLSFALFGQGTSASAQTNPPTTTTGVSAFASQFLDQLAAALGIQRTALDSAMLSAAQQTAATAVTDGTLTQEQADALVAQAQAGEYGRFFGGRGGRGGDHGGARVEGLRTAMAEAAAQTLGITTDELRTALRGGQTLAELAAANNTTEQAVIDAALAAAKTQLDAAVTAGTITQAQADAVYAELEAKGANLLSHGGRGPRGGNAAPADGTTAPTAPAAPNA